MKSLKNLAVVLLALLVLGGGVLAWNQYQELIKLRATVGTEGDRADLQRRLADLGQRLKTTQDQLAAARAQVAAGKESAGAPANDNAGTGLPGAGGMNFQALLNNPQIQKLTAMALKGSLDARYGALFKSLNLSPAQVDRLKELLVQRQQAQQDATLAALQQGMNPRTDPQGFRQAVAAAQDSVDDQIKAELGETGFAQYQQYQQTLPQRTIMTQVQQSLSYSATPLSDDQASQLTALLVQNAPPKANGATPAGGSPLITNQAIAAAQSFLSAPQVQALQQMQQQQQAQQQAAQQMMQMMETAGRAAGAAGRAEGSGAAPAP